MRHPYSWWDEHLEHEGRQRTATGFKAVCPAHADNRASLHVTRKGSDKIPPVLHCFSGCDYSAIEKAASEGVEATPVGPRVRKRATPSRDEVTGSKDPLGWLAEYTYVPRPFIDTLDIAAVGDRVHFTFPHNGIAKFRVASHTDKVMGWNKAGTFTPYLWPMPQDTLPERIFLAEGETDCIVLRYLGYPAFAITHGAGKALPPSVYRLLHERGVSHIVLAFDQDEAGEKAIEEYSDDIIEAGMTVSTIRPRLHILEGETDLRDWFRRTRGQEPLEDETETWALSLAAIEASGPSKIAWLAFGYFAAESVTMVAGPPKSGKSSLVFHLLQCHEKGEAFLGAPTKKGRAIIMSEEFAPTLLEKAIQFSLADVAVLTQHSAARNGWTFGDALARMVAQAKREKRDVLVIDTLTAWAQFKDENDASEVTRAMTLIRNTAAGSGLAVIVIHHTKKGGGEYGEGVRGSSALFAQADILIEYTHKDRSTRKVEVTSRYTNPPDPLFIRMNGDSQLEVLDQNEFNLEEAQPILDALAEGQKTRKELEVALGRSAGNTWLRNQLGELERLKKVDVTVGPRNVSTYTLTENGSHGGPQAKMNVRMVNRQNGPQRPTDEDTRRAP